jgi:NTP pyrophosphatase (non-canonical NTP hydrolase)
MDVNDYQQAALRTAAPRTKHNELFHLLLGLVGETGEIAEKAKKIVRDHESDFSQWDIEDLKKELGDSLWYIAVIADYFDVTLEEVARLNIAKLADRQRRWPLIRSLDQIVRRSNTGPWRAPTPRSNHSNGRRSSGRRCRSWTTGATAPVAESK